MPSPTPGCPEIALFPSLLLGHSDCVRVHISAFLPAWLWSTSVPGLCVILALGTQEELNEHLLTKSRLKVIQDVRQKLFRLSRLLLYCGNWNERYLPVPRLAPPPLHPHPTTGKKKSCHPQRMYKRALAVSTSASLTFLVAFPQWAECSHISFNKYLKAFIH